MRIIFETMAEAEDYYWANLAKHNDDVLGLDLWLTAQEIEEIEEDDFTGATDDPYEANDR